MAERVTIKFTEDQVREVIKALNQNKYVDFGYGKPLTKEQLAENAFIERLIKLFKAG